MSKVCARCEKTVFVTEELKCLDKVYHRGCFKCRECGMTLNMRTYKGFDKEPYCEAHIPKAQATTMAETPELRRIAENTKIQSNVKYHADFEKSKGKFTQVADDPETLRIKQNSKIISNVAYHGELQKKAAMEKQRTINENGKYVEAVEEPNANIHSQQQQHQHQQQQQHQHQHQHQHQPPPPQPQQHQHHHHHQQQHQQQQQQQHQQQQQQQHHAPQNPNIGKISDYDPLAGASPYSARSGGTQTLIYTSDRGPVNNPPTRSVGSIADIDPINHNYGSLGRVYRAMYDYDAQDTDEVSFLEGDLIINVSSIDGGWMTGEVQRTGDSGMLPANYVQLANI